MRVFLISTNTASSPYPVFPLGCAVVAKALRHAGHEVEIFDFMAEGGSLGEFEKRLGAFCPEMVGISIRNVDNVNVLEEETFLDIPRKVVEAARSLVPGAPVVLGGSGFSIMPEKMLERLGADYGVAGEGERAVVELAAEIADGKRPEKRIWRSDPLRGRGATDAAWRIMGADYPESLMAFYNSSGSIAPIQTKRGCPNHCVYCSYPFLEGREIRSRAPEDVLEEIRFLRGERGVDFIFFTDSVFNDAEGEYLKVVEALERSGLDVPWTAFFQPSEDLTAELAGRLVAAGLHSVELGVDATSDRALKAMGKGFSFDLARRCNETFAEQRIAVANYFMMGGPGETVDTVEEGIENIRGLERAVSFVFLGVRVLPGTPLLKLAIEEGVVSPDTDFTVPVYYFSPGLDRSWLEKRLDETLSRIKRCVYPPNSMDAGIAALRRMGYRGNLWEMMVPGSKRLPPRT
jgi:lipid biosynthesis B12-binding/radical SAM protein